MADKKLSFEQALAELEDIADRLEEGELSLDETIKLFEQGIKLSSLCADSLKTAKQKIETLKTEGEN